MIITPYNELTGTKMSGGTWTFVSGPVGNPAAPGTWNGTLDFSAVVNEGTYIYRYTVTAGACPVTADLSIEFALLTPAINDECADAVTISLGVVKDEITTVALGLTTASSCPGSDAATASDATIAEPANWGVVSSAPDLWYKITVPSSTSGWEINFAVDSASYGANGLQYPKIAVYETCVVGDLLGSSAHITQYGTVCTVSLAAPSVSTLLYIRVGSEVGNEGEFDLLINGSIGL